MEILPNINLSERELTTLIEHPIARGGEAIICSGSEDNRLVKLFINPLQKCWSDTIAVANLKEMTDNKFHKIEEFYQQEIESMVKPLSTISYNGQLFGYEMTYDKDDIPLASPLISKTSKEFAHYALESQEILQDYNRQGIIYGDVATRNILVNRKTKTVKFCDIDNIQYEDYPIDTMTVELKIYEIARGIDRNTDAYMHNMMLLRNYNLTLDNAENDENFQAHFAPQAQDIYNSLILPENFNGEYVAQYIKTRK